jgi:methylamine---glutamate N-methyltransferase subunit B
LKLNGLRELNSSLHALKGQTNMSAWEVINPRGAHAIAAGLDARRGAS